MTIFALTLCACHQTGPFDSGQAELEGADPLLIPELGDPQAEPEFPALSAGEAPSYEVLNGSELKQREDGPWVVRSGQLSVRGAGESKGGVLRRLASRAKRGVTRAVPSAPMMAMDMAMEEAVPTTVSSAAPGGASAYNAQSASPLRAGSTDDNEAFGEYLEFLATWTDRNALQEGFQQLDVAGRQYVRVLDGAGQPLPGARVRVASGQQVLQAGSCYGDGTVPFYPLLGLAEGQAASQGYLVEVSYEGERQVAAWDGAGPLTVQLDQAVEPESAVPMDVVFLIDTTGSMGDEIDRIKRTLLSVTDQIQELERPVDLRYGAVLYRDLGDEYVTSRHGFTADVQAFDQALQGISANGGGDGPESLNQGLAEAVHAMEWRSVAGKLVFLVADAPPHMDYEGDRPYGASALDAVGKGIRVHAVAASGLDGYAGAGSLIYRQVAQLTQGQFIFIEYGSTAASAASHGVTGPVSSNNLDGILYERIRDEVQGWRSDKARYVASR